MSSLASSKTAVALINRLPVSLPVSLPVGPRFWVAVCLGLLAAAGVGAAATAPPSVFFPLNSQLPPVARPGQFFSFQPSPDTFLFPSSPSSPLSFTLSAAPAWLSVDPASGRLSGTPPVDAVPAPGPDIVGVLIELVATSPAGASVSTNATLVVSRAVSPTVRVPIADQIAALGDFSPPSTLLDYPDTQFSYPLRPDTFSYQAGSINYYATSADGSPLPSWVSFDPTVLTFSGRTPPADSLIEPPQVFGFRLVASDVVGFSATSIVFAVAISLHRLSASGPAGPVVLLTATRGQLLVYDGLATRLGLDGHPVSPTALDVAVTDAPPWLSVDRAGLSLSGTPPLDALASNFTLTLNDSFGDSLDVLVVISFMAPLFRGALPPTTASPGQYLRIDLAPFFWQPLDVSVQLKTDPVSGAGWLSVDGLVLVGQVPANGASAGLQIYVEATSASTKEQQVQPLDLSISDLGQPHQTVSGTVCPSSMGATLSRASATATSPAQSSTLLTTTMATTMATTKPTGSARPSSQAANPSHTRLILAIVLPTLSVALGLLVLFCWRRRRQRQRAEWKARVLNISEPVAGTFTVNGSPESHLPSARSARETSSISSVTPTRVRSDRSRYPTPQSLRPVPKGSTGIDAHTPPFLRTGPGLVYEITPSPLFSTEFSEEFSHRFSDGFADRFRSVSDNVVRESRGQWLSSAAPSFAQSRGTKRRAGHRRYPFAVGVKSASLPAGESKVVDSPSAGGLLSHRGSVTFRGTADVAGPHLEDEEPQSSSSTQQSTPVQATSVSFGRPKTEFPRTSGQVQRLLPPEPRPSADDYSLSAANASSEALPSMPPSIPPRSRPHSPLVPKPSQPAAVPSLRTGPETPVQQMAQSGLGSEDGNGATKLGPYVERATLPRQQLPPPPLPSRRVTGQDRPLDSSRSSSSESSGSSLDILSSGGGGHYGYGGTENWRVIGRPSANADADTLPRVTPLRASVGLAGPVVEHRSDDGLGSGSLAREDSLEGRQDDFTAFI